MVSDDRRGDLRGVREERLFVKVLDCETRPELKDTTLSCATLDVSASGMQLLLAEALPKDALLQLWVEIKGCPGKFLLSGVVRWSRPNEDEFVCGVELKEDDELSDLKDWQDLFI